MNKSASRLLMAMLLILSVCLGSCSGNKDKRKLFETIPASTSGVFIVNLGEAMNQLEIKSKDGKTSYCSELSDILSKPDISKKDMKTFDQVLAGLDMTKKTAVVFEYDEELWLTFFVDDQDDFIKMLEEETDAAFYEEDGGYMVWKDMAIKDDQVWASSKKKIDTETISKFLDLDDEDTFAEKYAKITEELCADDLFSGCFVDWKLINQIAKIFDDDIAAVNTVLGIIFDDAKYIYGTSKLTESGVSSEVRMLNSKFEAATFNLPMAKIDAQSLALLNNDAPVIAAAAIDKELILQIRNLVESNAGMSNNDAEVFDILQKINGTIGASLASSTDGVAFMSFVDSNTPAAFSQMILQGVDSTMFNISTKGNMLIARLPGTPLAGRGTPPSELVGQYAGLYLDFSKDNGNFVNGADISSLGKAWITLGPDGKGIKLCANWNIKNPLRTLVSTGLKLFKAAVSGKITSPEGERLGNIFDPPYVEPDTVAYYDEYAYAYDSVAPAAEYYETPAAEYYEIPAPAAK